MLKNQQLRLNPLSKDMYYSDIASAYVAPNIIVATPTLSGIKVGLGTPELG